MLRIIHKNPIYREDNGFLSSNGRAAAASNTISSSNSAGGGATGGGSFREMMTGTMKVASVARYQKLQEVKYFKGGDGGRRLNSFAYRSLNILFIHSIALTLQTD